jgi:hypothetical protein
MAFSNADRTLIELVQRQLNSGATTVFLPAYLAADASDEVLDEIYRLCKLNGVTVEIRE